MGILKKIVAALKSEEPVEVQTADRPKNVKGHDIAGVKHYEANVEKLRIGKNPDYNLSVAQIVKKNLAYNNIYEYIYCTDNPQLIPEPDNQYDANAIKAVVNGQHIGYIKKGSCAHVNNILKSGRIEKITCTVKGGNFKSVGIDQKNGEELSMTNGKSQYYINFYITEK